MTYLKMHEVDEASIKRAKTLYESGAEIAVIAAELGVHHLSVVGYAKANGWVKPAHFDAAAVRRDWEAGVLSADEIAEKYGLPKKILLNMAGAGNWGRDLAKRIRRETESRLQVEVAKQLSDRRGELMEDAIVEANAQMQARVVKYHRTTASETRETVMRLLGELRGLAIPEEQLAAFAEIAAMRRSQMIDDFDEQEAAYQKALDTFLHLIGLNERSKTAKNLVDSLVKVVDLERKVFGIREEAQENDFVKALKELAESAGT